MRAADACEKVSRVRPEWLAAYKQQLLAHARRASEQELKWHLAQMLPRLPLTARQKASAVTLLKRFLDDPSRIVRVSALQALADFSAGDRRLRNELSAILARLKNDTAPSVQARARKLLREAPCSSGSATYLARLIFGPRTRNAQRRRAKKTVPATGVS